MATRRFTVEVAPPFRLDLTVWALRRRSHNAIDTWDGTWYRRTATLAGAPTEIAVRQEPQRATPLLAVELRRAGTTPDDGSVLEARRLLERTLGLAVDLSGFYVVAERDDVLSSLARRFVGMRPPRFPSVFETLVNAVACQQLSLTVGIHLLNRLVAGYGAVSPRPGGPGVFPAPERLATAEPAALRNLGFSNAKARAITLLAQRAASMAVDLEGLEDLDDAAARATLVALPGIGRWSAEYTLLRGLRRLEVLPGDDVGARNSVQRRFGLSDTGYEALAELSRRWWPYGGLVYFHLLLDGLAAAGEFKVDAGDGEVA